MAGNFDPLPGTSDIWEPDVSDWLFLENTARDVFKRYSYWEIRTPVLERTSCFVQGLGDDTEVVQKEMYTFEDRGGRSLTLRPEGTAGVIRALANAGLQEGEDRRVFYMGPMFRGERPAAGRRRQFHQVGVEAAGNNNPFIDAESIIMLLDYLNAIGVTQTRLLLNTRGKPEDRAQIADMLTHHFTSHKDSMCKDCQERLQRNIWRILDCKQEQCQPFIRTAPQIAEHLSSESRDFFDKVCRTLDGLGIEYEIDPRLVRGLDYYQDTVFEVVHEGLGSQDAVAGGGRYCINVPGSKNQVQGVGFALGMERLLMARESQGSRFTDPPAPQVYIANLNEEGIVTGQRLAQTLRAAGLCVYSEVQSKSLKAQMRKANKLGAEFSIIRGEEERNKGTASCRDLRTSEQTECPEAHVLSWLEDRIKDK